MKSTVKLMTLLLSLGITSFSFAQNDVTLKINHRLGAEVFDFGTSGTTNLDQTFTLDRLEYYLSEISITHDGGTITEIDSLWVLVDAGTSTEISLGQLMVNTVEAVTFHVGVDASVNHEDPTLWPSEHPLAPTSPSMHWGWSAGYRFVAMEGAMGLSADFEIHALGDVNYFQTNVDVADTAANGELEIDLFADYTMALYDIDLSAGVINHGETGEAKDCLKNFRDYVFSAEEITSTDTTDTSGTNSISQIENEFAVAITPNPAINGEINVVIKEPTLNTKDLAFELYDISGKRVNVNTYVSGTNRMQIDAVNKGVYILRIMDTQQGRHSIKRITVL